MSLTCQVQINLNNLSKEKAQTVKKALEPDNVNFPQGLSLNVKNIDNKVIFKFENEDSMKKLIATIDEVLAHVQVALKVIE
ncbi:MAG TPA: KEOPS complex subunit Pcc1 [Nitrosopumilaceae archaeon]|nr:KEOPS complex subunit Pcc1 [Nitrosopumilaceae archaeon]